MFFLISDLLLVFRSLQKYCALFSLMISFVQFNAGLAVVPRFILIVSLPFPSKKLCFVFPYDISFVQFNGGLTVVPRFILPPLKNWPRNNQQLQLSQAQRENKSGQDSEGPLHREALRAIGLGRTEGIRRINICS